MLIQPDLSEVQKDIGPGTYHVRVVKAEPGEWEKSGTKYVNWHLETTNEEEPSNNGRKLFDKTPVTGKGAFRLQQFYKAATGQVLESQFDTEELIGRELQVVVELNDKGYTDIKAYKPVQ